MLLRTFRIKSALLHLLFSVCLIGLVSFIAIRAWFPHPFYLLDGTLTAIGLVAVIDLVLGPLITLVIASANKTPRALLFDVCIILMIQLAALGFGVSKIYQERVIALVLAGGVFHLVPEKKINKPDLANVQLPDYKSVFYGELPESGLAIQSNADAKAKFDDIGLYRPISHDVSIIEVPKSRIPQTLLSRYGKDNYSYVILVGKAKNGLAVLDQSMNIVEVVVQES